jgi:hypothetical protein
MLIALILFVGFCSFAVANSDIHNQILEETETKPGEFNINLVKSPHVKSKLSIKGNEGRNSNIEGNSYLQIKYVAQDYLQLDSECTSDCQFNSAMRDIPYNGFTGVVGIGSHPQKLYCIYDTGSSVMFVNSMSCTNDHCEDNPQVTSETRVPLLNEDGSQRTERITYGGGFLTGDLVNDTVIIGGAEIPDQTMAEVTAEDDGSTPNFSCLIGLSFPELSPNGEDLLFDHMMRIGTLSENLFTTYIYPDREHADLYFGAILDKYYCPDSENCEDLITWAPVQRREHWNIQVTDVLVDGVSTGICDTDSGCQGIVDTGTSANTFESTQYDAIFGGENPLITPNFYPCDTANPDITFVIGGEEFTFSASEYSSETEQGDCSSDFSVMDVWSDPNAPAIVLGDSFLRKYFVIYDRSDDENPQIGFALANTELTIDPEADEWRAVDCMPDNTGGIQTNDESR